MSDDLRDILMVIAYVLIVYVLSTYMYEKGFEDGRKETELIRKWIHEKREKERKKKE